MKKLVILILYGLSMMAMSSVRGMADPYHEYHRYCDELTLTLAAINNDLPILANILETKPDINTKVIGGMTPLMHAATKGHLDIVHYLLEHGAEVNAQTGLQFTALMCASFTDHPDIVQTLMEHDALTSTKTLHGESAIDMAATDEIRLLLTLPSKKLKRLTPEKMDKGMSP